MTKVEQFIQFINKYSKLYQEKYALNVEEPVEITLMAHHGLINLTHQIPVTLIEPATMPVGQYWIDGEFLRKCVSNTPTQSFQNEYTLITDFDETFGPTLQITSEYIDVGSTEPLPSVTQPPGRGAIKVSDGVYYKAFAVGTNGEAIISDDSEPLGVKWKPIVTLTGTETVLNKTLVSPVLSGNISGNAVLDQDDFALNSSTKLITQRSAKYYVDTKFASVTQFGFKLNITNDNGDIKCMMDPTPGYQKNNNSLSNDISGALTAGTPVVVDSITYAMDEDSMAILVNINGQTITYVLGLTLLANSTKNNLIGNFEVSGGGVAINFTDVNGYNVPFTDMPNLSTLSVLLVYSATTL